MKRLFLSLGLSLVACGGAQAAPPAEPAPAAPTAEEKSAESTPAPAAKPSAAAEPVSVPTGCVKSGRLCMPDQKFSKRMCNSGSPSLALYLFGNGFGFTRGYLTRKTQAWNAAGGASDNSFLEFDEEVLLLVERGGDASGMQVSGAGGGYEALRWNGLCVTLAKEEVTLDKPPSPKAAKVEWRFLDDNVQAALREDSTINAAVSKRRQECKGAVSGDVSLGCVKADDKLTRVLVDYLRKGGKVPVPSKLPD
ncbi:MAG TPA: hypothetical protein VHM25_15580 [Polyangiaceae bacterium]|jgi:hypothetical protein|nr:hypothetical protein [Polyangiaceae bacterium]